MNEARQDRQRGTFSANVTAPGSARHGFDLFRRGWERQVGGRYPAPHFAPGHPGGFRISVRAVKVHDSVIADVHSESLIGTNTGVPDHGDDRVLLHVVQRRAWTFARPRGGEVTVPAGSFMIRHSGPATFEAAPRASAKVLILPAAPLAPLVGDRLITGPAGSAETRLLMAHAAVLASMPGALTPAGARTAHDALIELVKGVLLRHPDAADPSLAPALVRAAQDLADGLLTDPGLSPPLLARALNVSVRTLHRAFATTGESVAGYIRRRRLEQARLALSAPEPRPSVVELAARWQFADSSHLIRAFKSRYGQTPAEFARSSHP